MRSLLVAACIALSLQAPGAQAPDQYFGFHIGADGELARYPKIVEYLQHLSTTTNRVKFEEVGKTTRVLAVWSKKLEALGQWYDQLLAESLGKQGRGPLPVTTVQTRDLHSRGQHSVGLSIPRRLGGMW